MLYSPTDSGVSANNMPMVGNGFLATQVSSTDMYVAGLFNGFSTVSPSHRARIPATAAVAAPGTPGPSALDVREATYLRRSYLDPAAPGACTNASTASCSNAAGRLWVEQRWYAHRALPSVLVMEVQTLLPPADTRVAPGAPLAVLRLDNSPGGPSTDVLFKAVPLPDGTPYEIINGSTLLSETNSSGLWGVAVLTTAAPPNDCLVIPPAEGNATYAFLTVIRTTIETPSEELVSAVEADWATAVAMAANGTLHSTHVAEWAETIWPAGFGTDRHDLACAVNSSLYAILSSVRNDREFGLSPGGLTAGYNGHTFWDQETWMYPGMLLLHPDTAASLLEYRVKRLAGAREKALSYSPPFGGAMFPWESAFTGQETCPSWAATGLREIHINGDIAFAVWQFWRATQDAGLAWVNATAWPLLQGISEFWISKLALDNPGASPTSALSLRNVIPPDEYQDHVNNSAYTNMGAIATLQYAAAVAQLIGQPPAIYSPWLDAASRIIIPFNSTGGYHPEFDGYTLGTKIKQADVILMGYPWEFQHENFTAQTRANDLAVYGPVTDPGGPAMTWGMFAVGYIELGPSFAAQAASNFNRSFANAQPPFDVWTETPTGGTPNFLTGAGGFLQTAFSGYTGLRTNDTALTLAPGLPEGATRMQLRGVAYLGARLDVAYDAQTLSVTVQAPEPPQTADAAALSQRLLRSYAPLRGGATPPASRPLRPLSERSQAGRVVLKGGVVVRQQALALVDASGASHALAPGVPVELPLQAVAIVAA